MSAIPMATNFVPSIGTDRARNLMAHRVTLVASRPTRSSVQGRCGQIAVATRRDGRMAFTNYITQSHHDLEALTGKFDRPWLWALTIAIWILQLIWSALWLSRFEMGLLEWVRRSLTVRHQVPLLRKPV